MTGSMSRNGVALLAGLLAALVAGGAPADPNFVPPPRHPPRYTAFISDLHMGLGQVDGRWHPYEDFRWPGALAGFLEAVSARGGGNVDLVIVGDFLELWQIPEDIACNGRGADLGCTVDEMVRMARRVVAAHSGVTADGTPHAFDALREFSRRGGNRVHVLPGNHDATLLLPGVWAPVAQALGAESGRVNLVGKASAGVWVSGDGRIVSEHGHQMGADLNRYKRWPQIVDPASGLVERVEGELNVQQLFNDVERSYPLIDNLSPEIRGAWYRMQDRGAWGTVADIGKLLLFLLFETSISQMRDILGGEPQRDAGGRVIWDLRYARDKLGYRVVVLALPKDDAVRKALTEEPADDQAKALRATLDERVRALPDTDLQHLCDQLALRDPEKRCREPTLGAISEYVFSSRDRIKREHLIERRKSYPRMRTFVYGHTHQIEAGHDIKLSDVNYVKVFNTGAFQRLIDDAGYRRRLERNHPGTSPAEGLSRLDLERDLPPCYTAVLAPVENGRHVPETVRWHMPEGRQGNFVAVDDARCQ